MSEPAPLPVALNLRSRSVLVIGGAEEAADKVPKLLAAGARVTLVSASLNEALRPWVVRRAFDWFARGVHESDLSGAHWVLLTEPDPELARRLCALKPRYGFWLSALDQPAFSDVFLVSTLRRGPVQIGVSTGGRAPLLARRLRRALESGLDTRFGEFARKFAELRERLRTLPKTERKQRLEAALNGFAIEVTVRYPAQGLPGDPPPGGTDESSTLSAADVKPKVV